MAVIRFTDADALATKVVEAGCYPSEVSKIEGPVKSGSGKSFHYIVDVSITDGPYKGKTRTLMFNTETRSASLLGEMQFYPSSHLMLLNEVINGVPLGAQELDTDTLLHKPFDVDWGIGTAEGHMFNIITGFHAPGYGSSGPAF